MKAEDVDKLARFQRNAALSALARFNLYEGKYHGGAPKSQTELAEAYGLISDDTRESDRTERLAALKTFLEGRSGGSGSGGRKEVAQEQHALIVAAIKKFWSKRITIDDACEDGQKMLPEFVRAAYFQAFPKTYETPDGKSFTAESIKASVLGSAKDPRFQKLDSIFWRIGHILQQAAAGSEHPTRAKLKEMSEKVFDVYRWTGPTTKEEKGQGEDGKVSLGRRPRAIRAALKFGPHPNDQNAIFFTMRYRPVAKDDPLYPISEVNKCGGYAVPVGQ